MKKFWKKLPLFLALPLAVFFSACFNSSSTPPPVVPVVNYFSQDSLSHRAYIGGSLIFNPDNALLSQLYYGARIAVRTSKLQKKTVELYSLPGDLRQDMNISVSADGTWSSGTAETFDTYITEVEGSDVYGFFVVLGVTKDAIALSYQYYPNKHSTLAAENFTLALGQSKKLGSGNSEIKYETPKVVRKGFENARWLTFVNSEDTLTACMFSRMPEINGRPASTLYGVNTDNDFIYVVGDQMDANNFYPTNLPNHSEMVSYGDYIVDQKDGKIYAICGDTSNGYQHAMKERSAYNATDKTEDFIDFAYYKYQFPDPVNGPKALFDALPQSVKNNAPQTVPGETEADKYLNRLNWCLCNNAVFSDYIATDLTNKGKTEYAEDVKDAISSLSGYSDKTVSWRSKILNGQFSNAIENDLGEWLEAVRSIMDDLYDESPDAYVDPPTMFNAYPDMALDLGGDPAAAFDYSASNIIPDTFSLNGSKSFDTAKKYDEYVQKRDQIVNKFKEYHQLELAKVNGNKLSTIGVNFAFGVKGKIVKNLGIKSGEFGIRGLGSAIFLKAEATMQKVDLGEHSFFDEETQKKMEKNVFEPIKFAIGPVPCIFKTTFKFDFGWKAKVSSNVKYMAGLTALLGGEMDLGASWGVKFKWKVIPVGGYFNTWPTNTKSVTDTVFYVGPADSAPDMSPGLDVGVYVSGTLTPQIGVGVEYICAGFEVPARAQPEVHFIIDDKFLQQYKTMQHLQGLLGLSVTFGPFFEVTIPIIGKKVKTNWTAFKILDKGGDKAIEIFDVPL